MRIITTTADDFVKSEIDEWGFDYVEAKFAEGYEPTLVNGIWLWRQPITVASFNSLTGLGGLSSSGGKADKAQNFIVKLS